MRLPPVAPESAQHREHRDSTVPQNSRLEVRTTQVWRTHQRCWALPHSGHSTQVLVCCVASARVRSPFVFVLESMMFVLRVFSLSRRSTPLKKGALTLTLSR